MGNKLNPEILNKTSNTLIPSASSDSYPDWRGQRRVLIFKELKQDISLSQLLNMFSSIYELIINLQSSDIHCFGNY